MTPVKGRPESEADAVFSAVGDLGRFTASSSRFAALSAHKERLSSLAASLALQKDNLNGSLLILLLGGTGVGKSTLINAIAGREIAEASVTRPCTRRVTFYSHEENDLSPIQSVISVSDSLQTHRDETLRRKILIDPPDFDSTVEENRIVLNRVLDASDLIVVVADREKYRNESLYRLMATHSSGKTFVFVLNKSDEFFDPAVLEDFRSSVESAGFAPARMFAVSALDALSGRRDRARDFDALEAVIRSEIDKVRIREIKESNVGGLLRHAVAEIGRCIPAGARSGIGDWLAQSESEIRRAASTAAAHVHATVFLGDRPLAESAAAASSRDIGGIFGSYLAVRDRIAALTGNPLQAMLAAGDGSPSAEVSGRLERIDGARISMLAGTAAQRIRERAADAGLVPPEITAPSLSDAVCAMAFAGQAGIEAAQRLASMLPKPGRRSIVAGFVWNAFPVLMLGYMVFHMLSRMLAGKEMPGLEFIAGGLFLVLAICVVQGAALDSSIRRKARRLTAAVGEDTASIFLERFRRDLGAPVSDCAAAALAELSAFESLKKRAGDPVR